MKKGPGFGIRVQMSRSLARNAMGLMKKKIWHLKGLGLKRKPSHKSDQKKRKEIKIGREIRAECMDRAQLQPFIGKKCRERMGERRT